MHLKYKINLNAIIYSSVVKLVMLMLFLQKMKSCMAEAETLQPVYRKMADSIK